MCRYSTGNLHPFMYFKCILICNLLSLECWWTNFGKILKNTSICYLNWRCIYESDIRGYMQVYTKLLTPKQIDKSQTRHMLSVYKRNWRWTYETGNRIEQLITPGLYGDITLLRLLYCSSLSYHGLTHKIATFINAICYGCRIKSIHIQIWNILLHSSYDCHYTVTKFQIFFLKSIPRTVLCSICSQCLSRNTMS